jgi:hypothetical protein
MGYFSLVDYQYIPPTLSAVDTAAQTTTIIHATFRAHFARTFVV